MRPTQVVSSPRPCGGFAPAVRSKASAFCGAGALFFQRHGSANSPALRWCSRIAARRMRSSVLRTLSTAH